MIYWKLILSIFPTYLHDDLNGQRAILVVDPSLQTHPLSIPSKSPIVFIVDPAGHAVPATAVVKGYNG